ncbi:acyl-CoA thioesterase [Micrococcoides hystricis]|uniref:Acyl-CoA thioesterase n=1 Tax=Micrococcoides hystricis TaxID=1572761 RepID=A0ABV6P8U2_9MICC
MSEQSLTPPSPDKRVQYLHDLLTLSPNGDDADTGEELFLGPVAQQHQHRVFGGQVLAQGVMACTQTVNPERPLHSIHAYFLRPGDSKKPITFGVDRLRDGRSFSARRANAYQDGKPILSMLASFQSPAEGYDHQISMPADLPQPEDLDSVAVQLGHINHPVAQEWAWERPFDIRHVDPPLWLYAAKERKNTNMVWLRTPAAFAVNDAMHKAALAYASDYTVLEPVLRQHGVHWTRPEMSVASLDHAMWWHRPAPVDDWLLYVSDSPSAQGARGLGLGHFFTRDGLLVATVGQEGMLRVPDTFRTRMKQLAQDAVIRTASWRKPRSRWGGRNGS